MSISGASFRCCHDGDLVESQRWDVMNYKQRSRTRLFASRDVEGLFVCFLM